MFKDVIKVNKCGRFSGINNWIELNLTSKHLEEIAVKLCYVVPCNPLDSVFNSVFSFSESGIIHRSNHMQIIL